MHGHSSGGKCGSGIVQPFLIYGEKGEIPLSHTGHYTNTPLQTPLTVLSCGLNGL